MSIAGAAALEPLPRTAVLARYGGGEDLQIGEFLAGVSVPVVPEELRVAAFAAARALISRVGGGGNHDSVAAEHLPAVWPLRAGEEGGEQPIELSWSSAVSVCCPPRAFASGSAESQESGSEEPVNVFFHGWLFSDALDAADARGESVSAMQKFPLAGVWRPLGSGKGLLARPKPAEPHLFCDAAGFDVRDAGLLPDHLYPADQHIHTVDPYAGGDRTSTVELYLSEGYDRETAEAIVDASVDEMGAFHLGSDSARISLHSPLPDAGSAIWAVVVDLSNTEDLRAQATLLVALPPDATTAGPFRALPSDADWPSFAAAVVASKLDPEIAESILAAGGGDGKIP
jgi:hypothetical protein